MSKPNQSAIVVLVPQAGGFVRSIRQCYGLAPPRVPAHITILFPFKPPDKLTPSVVADLRQLFARYGPFSFSLFELGTFPDTLYLVPTPGEPFVELTRAVYEQFPETPPYEGAFEEIIPHLTLAHAPEEVPIERMVQEVEVDLCPQLPLEIRATEISLLDNACGEWCVNSTFVLGG